MNCAANSWEIIDSRGAITYDRVQSRAMIPLPRNISGSLHE